MSDPQSDKPTEPAATPGPDSPPLGTRDETTINPQTLQAMLETFDRHARPGVTPPPTPAPASDGQTEEHLQELVEDMLDLLRRVKGIETTQTAVMDRLDRLDQSLREGLFLQAKETDAVRRELIGEQKAFAALSTFEAIVPVLDKLRPMRAALNPRKQEALVNQLDAILEVLSSMLRTLGFTLFVPAVGEKFDPLRMRCAGQAKGAAGVVLGVVQPGYVVRDTVVRPAGVVLAAPVNVSSTR